MSWKFEVYGDIGSSYRWRLKASNGRIVADSGEGYASRSDARRATENVRSRLGSAAIEDIY